MLKALFYANLHKLVEGLNSPVYNFAPPDSDSVACKLFYVISGLQHITERLTLLVNNRISDL